MDPLSEGLLSPHVRMQQYPAAALARTGDRACAHVTRGGPRQDGKGRRRSESARLFCHWWQLNAR
eukprot:3815841-Pyramimonas_sp.AAC.1